MRGHVLLASLEGRLAVWQVSPAAVRSGAWAFDLPVDATQARALLSLIERRALAGLDRDDDWAVVSELGRIAGVAIPATYRDAWVDLAQVHLEVAHAREELARVLRERRREAKQRTPSEGGASLAALTYTYPVSSEPWPRELPEALHAAQLALPISPAGPAERAALGKALLLHAAHERWADTESVRLRREWLRDVPGPHPRTLPPRWQERLTASYEAVLEL